MEATENMDRLLEIARHEASHYVVASAMGFAGRKITIHYQDGENFHGKADHDLEQRCVSLLEVEQYATRRTITLMSGAIGEALAADGQINRKEADRIFEGPYTGTDTDRSVAHEFIHLIHHVAQNQAPSPAQIKNRLWKLSIGVVLMCAPVVEGIARALVATLEIKRDGLHLELTNQQIEMLLGEEIPRLDGQLDKIEKQIEGMLSSSE